MRTLIAKMPQGPDIAPSVNLLESGQNRFGFVLVDRGNKQIGGVRVGLYVSGGLDETARGPFAGRFERIDVAPRFQSKQSVNDPDGARSIYVARIPFKEPGGYTITAVSELDKHYVASPPVQVMVSRGSSVPAVGDRAIRVHTPTLSSVGGDIKKIETRDPPDAMHQVDFADALDRGRPALLLFSTPGLCQSRVCGPVTDVAAQVKSEFGSRMDFIHMEVYKDNDPQKGVRPQLRAWHLNSEPLAFAVDRRGRVAERLQGAFSVPELRAAVRKALR